MGFACEKPLEEVNFPEKVDYWIPRLREDITSLYLEGRHYRDAVVRA